MVLGVTLGIAVIGAAVGLAFASFGGVARQGVEPPALHSYPSPSYWPMSPYSDPAPPAAPETTVAPCPPGQVPTTATWRGRTVPACMVPGGVSSDPGTGPMCEAANGTLYPPIKEPDGSYDCG